MPMSSGTFTASTAWIRDSTLIFASATSCQNANAAGNLDPSAARLLSSAKIVIDQRSLDVFIVSSLQWIMNLL